MYKFIRLSSHPCRPVPTHIEFTACVIVKKASFKAPADQEALLPPGWSDGIVTRAINEKKENEEEVDRRLKEGSGKYSSTRIASLSVKILDGGIDEENMQKFWADRKVGGVITYAGFRHKVGGVITYVTLSLTT